MDNTDIQGPHAIDLIAGLQEKRDFVVLPKHVHSRCVGRLCAGLVVVVVVVVVVGGGGGSDGGGGGSDAANAVAVVVVRVVVVATSCSPFSLPSSLLIRYRHHLSSHLPSCSFSFHPPCLFSFSLPVIHPPTHLVLRSDHAPLFASPLGTQVVQVVWWGIDV